MAKTKLELGVTLDLLNKDELGDALHKHSSWERDAAFGVRHQALPRMVGTPSGGVLNLGYDQPEGTYCGPREGFYWAVSRISVDGLAVTPSPVTLTASNEVLNPGASAIITSISAASLATVAPAGTTLWAVTWSASLQGTVAAGDANNMQLESALVTHQPGIFPAAVGNYPQLPFSFIVPSGGGLTVLATNASSGGGVTYGAQISATPLSTPGTGFTTMDTVKIYNQNRFVCVIPAVPGFATFGIRECVMKPGDFLRVVGSGLQTTGQVEVFGEAISAPGPMMWKLFT